MTKGYVVLEIGWEYNDETYSRSESGAGRPVVVYKQRATAEQAVVALNKESQEKNKTWDMCDGDEKPITDFFEVVPVEMED